MKQKTILILISLSLCIAYYSQWRYRIQAYTQGDIYRTMKVFTGFNDWNFYRTKINPTIRSRFLPNIIAGIYFRSFVPKQIDIRQFSKIICGWQTFWLGAALLVLLLYRKSLLWIFGIFAGTQFDFMHGAIYPYDGPVLFLSVLLVLVNKKYLPWLIILAMACKETAIIFCLLPVLTRDKRLTLICLACAVGTKLLVDLSVGDPGNLLLTGGTHVAFGQGLMQWENNLHYLLTTGMPLLSGCGMVAGALLIGNNVYRAMVILLAVNLFIFGNYSEFRVWHEIIPLFLVSYHVSEKKTY